MLRYMEFGLSYEEVPGEIALCIYITGCNDRCADCHYSELWQKEAGELLADYFEQILDLYHEYTTCVCFMGEGENTEASRLELLRYVDESHKSGYRCCLYSGRDTEIEHWMRLFDYVKIGSYDKELGPLTSCTTNQKLWMNAGNGEFLDITYRFWSR